MIRFANLCKQYPNGHEALIRVNFELKKGAMAFLTGHSGAGKTTFLKIAGSLERATRGQAVVNGVDLMSIGHKGIAEFRRHIGIVLQDPYLLTHKTVHDNVALPLMIAGSSKPEIAKRVRAALDKVNLLDKEQYLAEELSAGEKQRVSLARAIINKPALILADEPTGNLDPDLAKEMIALFAEFNRAGSTVFIASHDHHLMEDLPYEIVTLEQGRLVETDPQDVSELEADEEESDEDEDDDDEEE